MKRYILPVWLCAAIGVLPAAFLSPASHLPATVLGQLQTLLGYCMGAGLVAAGAGWIHLARTDAPRKALRTAFLGGLLTSLLLAGFAHAADFKAEAEQCKRIGQFAKQVAKQRDAGVRKEAVLAALPKGDSAAKRVIEGLFKNRTISPAEAANLELGCLLEIGKPGQTPSLPVEPKPAASGLFVVPQIYFLHLLTRFNLHM